MSVTSNKLFIQAYYDYQLSIAQVRRLQIDPNGDKNDFYEHIKRATYFLKCFLEVAFAEIKNKQDTSNAFKDWLRWNQDRIAERVKEIEQLNASKKRVETPLHRKGLSSLSIEQVTSLLQLPMSLKIGAAVDDGGCFFDALAQSLNYIQKTDQYTEKVLRMICHTYYSEHKREVDQWNERDYGGIDKGEEYYFVQYTSAELQRFNQRASIWGRPHIEGLMLCRQLNLIQIRLVELTINPDNNQTIATHFLITKEDVKQVETNEIPLLFNDEIPTLVVGQRELHFVPILPKEKDLEQQVDPLEDPKNQLNLLEEHTYADFFNNVTLNLRNIINVDDAFLTEYAEYQHALNVAKLKKPLLLSLARNVAGRFVSILSNVARNHYFEWFNQNQTKLENELGFISNVMKNLNQGFVVENLNNLWIKTSELVENDKELENNQAESLDLALKKITDKLKQTALEKIRDTLMEKFRRLQEALNKGLDEAFSIMKTINDAIAHPKDTYKQIVIAVKDPKAAWKAIKEWAKEHPWKACFLTIAGFAVIAGSIVGAMHLVPEVILAVTPTPKPTMIPIFLNGEIFAEYPHYGSMFIEVGAGLLRAAGLVGGSVAAVATGAVIASGAGKGAVIVRAMEEEEQRLKEKHKEAEAAIENAVTEKERLLAEQKEEEILVELARAEARRKAAKRRAERLTPEQDVEKRKIEQYIVEHQALLTVFLDKEKKLYDRQAEINQSIQGNQNSANSLIQSRTEIQQQSEQIHSNMYAFWERSPNKDSEETRENLETVGSEQAYNPKDEEDSNNDHRSNYG